MEPEAWYLFEARYRALKVDEPLRSGLVRIVWRDEKGKQIGRAEYPATVAERSSRDWSLIRQVYQAPPRSTGADIELVLRWDADGVVHFAEPGLKKVTAPLRRKVRLASVHYRPRGSRIPRERATEKALRTRQSEGE